MPRLIKLENGNYVRPSDIRSIRIEHPIPAEFARGWQVVIRHGDSFPPAEAEIIDCTSKEDAVLLASELGQLADREMIAEANRSAAGGDLCAVATIAAGYLADPNLCTTDEDLINGAWAVFEAIKGYRKT